jgi:DNA-binding winged helix-turn-helix (wHTH) protein/TolB-like protein
MSANEANSAIASEFRFVGYTLDLRQGRLWDASGDVALRPKPFALLVYMVRNAGRVLSKDELLQAVWPDVIVTEDSLSQCIHALREGLGEVGQGLIRTVPRRGYLFDLGGAPAMPRRNAEGHVAGDQPGTSAGPSSLAVLPFAVAASLSPECQLWFDGVANDVISRLARLRSFDVIARSSSFALRDQASDAMRAGKLLGADYVLAGSVVPDGDGFRLQIDLVRTDGGTIQWTDEIGIVRDSFLSLVGALVDRITTAVLSEVTTSERNRARLVPDRSLTAWQAYHRGLEAFGIYSEPTLLRARAYFTQATELDPGFVRAFAALSECQACLARTAYCTDQGAEALASLRTAETAMRLDEAAPAAQFAYAHASWSNGANERALVHARQSVALSPSFADGFAEIGFYAAMYGDPDLAIANLSRAEVLNPISPFIDSVHIDRAIACLQGDRMEEARLWATKAVSRRESYPQMQITGALILAAAGSLDAARLIVTILRDQNAVFDPQKVFRPPFSISGPAKDRLLRAVADLGL